MGDSVLISVVEPGMLTTVQDVGRFGQSRFGVAPGGALDRRALVLGNRVLGNPADAACLEISLVGPKLAFTDPTVISLTGADLGTRLNGAPVSRWEPIAIAAGDEISFDPAGVGSGTRAYLCVAGGIEVEPVLGSRSTDLIGIFGGYNGRALRRGDQLPVGTPLLESDQILRRRLSRTPEEPATEISARVVLGPQLERFTREGVATFLGGAFDISGKSNRQGIRLSGHVIEHVRGADMVSEGIAHGAVQVPGDGLPIVLLAGRQTVGGYVKIATVIGADLDSLAQLRPGSQLRFDEVSVEEARAASAAYRAELASNVVTESASIFRGATPSNQESELIAMGGIWDPDGVVRVIEAWERSSAASFKLEVAEFGLKLELQRDQAGPATGKSEAATSLAQENSQPFEIEVSAPVLGVFFRRSAPDQPVLAEEGSIVTAGQVICVLEVMKTYHEVTVPQSGRLLAFSVKDGDFVEYGQVIARIAPQSI